MQLRDAFSLNSRNASVGKKPDEVKQVKTMKEGTVKFFNHSKGFGFIEGETGKDIFVHATGLVDKISDNDRVTYSEQDSDRGPTAVDVRLL